MSAKEPTHIPPAHGAHDTSEAVRTYLMIFIALGVLTLATVGVAYLQLPHAAGVVIALVIALAKVYLIGSFFMHLRTEGRLITYSLAATVGLILILIVFVLPDLGVHEIERAHQDAQRNATEHHVATGDPLAPGAQDQDPHEAAH